MRTATLAVCVLAIIVYAVFAKPQGPKKDAAIEPKKVGPAQLKIVGPTNWGVLTQSGKLLAFNGDPTWDGAGEIRADGTVVIVWTLKSTSEPCPGIYDAPRESDGALVGVWGYSSKGVHIDDDGNLQPGFNGYLLNDVTRRVEVPNAN